MDTAEQILVIFLSTALAIFLVLAITIAIMVVRLVANLRMIAQKAESIVDSAESVAEMFKKASGPLTVMHFIRGIARAVADKQKDK